MKTRLLVLALAFTLMAGAGCRKKNSEEPPPAPQQQEQTVESQVVNGPNATIYPRNTGTPDEWQLPSGEKFVSVIEANNKMFMMSRCNDGVTSKIYFMDEETGTLEASYIIKDGY